MQANQEKLKATDMVVTPEEKEAMVEQQMSLMMMPQW
jgi:hypothetical protein